MTQLSPRSRRGGAHRPRRHLAPWWRARLAFRALDGPVWHRALLAPIVACDWSGEWWTGPADLDATVHIRRVTHPSIRAPIAATIALSGLCGIAFSPFIVGSVLGRVAPFIVAMVPVVTTGVSTAVESARAMRFTHRIDTYSSNWRRLNGPPGSGVQLLEFVNNRENAAGRTIGGQAGHDDVVARHLAAGRELDATATMRTIATPSPTVLVDVQVAIADDFAYQHRKVPTRVGERDLNVEQASAVLRGSRETRRNPPGLGL